MPSADDLFNQLVAANNRLEAIKGNLLDLEAATDAVKFAVNQVNSTLTTGFRQLVTQGDYTNKAARRQRRPILPRTARDAQMALKVLSMCSLRSKALWLYQITY
jgi:hypothetical protein